MTPLEQAQMTLARASDLGKAVLVGGDYLRIQEIPDRFPYNSPNRKQAENEHSPRANSLAPGECSHSGPDYHFTL